MTLVRAFFPVRWQPSWRHCARCGEPVTQDECCAAVDALTGVEVALHLDYDVCKAALG